MHGVGVVVLIPQDENMTVPLGTDNDESKPESKKRGRKKKVVQGEVIDVDMEANGSEVLPPSPA